jgi:SAM-dependent methyltransferase
MNSVSPPDLERWETRFASENYVFGTEPNAFLAREATRLAPGSRVLAVADGEGRNGVFLAERGMDVLSVDFSPNARKKAEALARARGVTLKTETADLREWRWPDAAFDAVAAIFVQFAAPDFRPRFFANMMAALKPGGLLFLEGYRVEQLAYKTGGPSDIAHLYTEAMLREAFGAAEILLLSAEDRDLREGEGHRGRSAVIDLIARRPA